MLTVLPFFISVLTQRDQINRIRTNNYPFFVGGSLRWSWSKEIYTDPSLLKLKRGQTASLIKRKWRSEAWHAAGLGRDGLCYQNGTHLNFKINGDEFRARLAIRTFVNVGTVRSIVFGDRMSVITKGTSNYIHYVYFWRWGELASLLIRLRFISNDQMVDF